MSPMDYHKKPKVKSSKILLCETNLSVSEIAARYSFSNAYHYSNAFKKIVGISPTEYRKLHKAEK